MDSGGRTLKNKTKAIIENFWLRSLHKADTESWNYKDLQLPLARIKRLMKVEEEVKMVASEVPILFSKVAEMFIEELTLRAWINTEENKRRILQKNDLSAAVRTSDVYDFLIFIIPRNELDPAYTAYEDNQGMEDNIKPFYNDGQFYGKHPDNLVSKQTMNHDYANYSVNAPTAESNLPQHER
ncbi:CCAAT-binding factor, subunit C (HAP5) [Trachipleistophora hominis]|uniref:CCAAT-binding factor, subunit C (HAP5) n=1 Tax=Trachipleistophora hominis TaxID=72359 RepID=L7JT24_TRAHO|nr:CCAAT-binding factor, subunit C (HAP5) [Trachipleistophora hominis]